MWSCVKCSHLEWTDVIYVKWICFEVKWVTVKFLGTKVPCTFVWPGSECTWLYCDYFIWCVSCTVVVLTGFVMCERVCMCGRVGNMYTCIYCVLYCLYCEFVFFRLRLLILLCFVCTSVKTTATEWQLNCSDDDGDDDDNNNNNNNNTFYNF
jgi:hypothetical protein